MASQRLRSTILIAIAACALVIVAFSFLHWVDFGRADADLFEGGLPPSFSLDGTEISRIQGANSIESATDATVNGCTCRAGFGDGYYVAILGTIVLVMAAAALLTAIDLRLLMAVAIIASLAAFTIAGYNAIADWQGVGRATQMQPLQNLDGEVRAELYLLVAAAGLAAVLGGAVLATAARPAPEYEPDEDETDETNEQSQTPEEVNEAWA